MILLLFYMVKSRRITSCSISTIPGRFGGEDKPPIPMISALHPMT